MIKREIKSIFGKLLFEYECEKNTIAKTVQKAVESSANLNSADLSYANLSYADLRYADLRSANLRSANLNSADLSYANLSSANLNSADLSSANLRSADLDKRYIQIACIGSRKGMTTYCFDDDIIWWGCFIGSLAEFEARVAEMHKNNDLFLKEYMGFIGYLKSLQYK